MNILITGSCGFIGFHLASLFLKKKFVVYGIDTLNNYYDVNLKKERLSLLKKFKNFHFKKIDISNRKKIDSFFSKTKIDTVVNLAAYAGVQYSKIKPDIYFSTNEIGFYNILENSRKNNIKKIIFASSSSVVGNNKELVSNENDKTDEPISLYAATKKNNEILAHYYACNYKMTIIGARFFTAYGEYGRPDLSIYKFSSQILNNKKLTLNNHGNHFRDFTFIEDVTKSLFKLFKLKKFNKFDQNKNKYFQVFNIGGGKQIKITVLVNLLEKLFNKKASKINGPLIKGDVVNSKASTTKLYRNIKYKPNTRIEDGLKKFAKWFIDHKNLNN